MFQDGRVNEVRVAGISMVPAANRYLHERFSPATKPALPSQPPIRREEERTVAQDNTLFLACGALRGERLYWTAP
jgi:hypothetical protein